MTQGPWLAELTTPNAAGLLAALRRRDPGLPSWDMAVALFRDYDQQAAQDRIARALASAYQAADLRAGPILVALLWHRTAKATRTDKGGHAVEVLWINRAPQQTLFTESPFNAVVRRD